MATTVYRKGYGQVEPNHLSAQRNGQIYAQLPADINYDHLENGQFVKYDISKGKCTKQGSMEWFLVFNEVKLYDVFWKESYKDYAMIRDNFTPDSYPRPKVNKDGTLAEDWVETIVEHDGYTFPGQMVPRVFKTNVGDIMTLNTLIGPNTSGSALLSLGKDTAYEVGTVLKVNDNGFLDPAGTSDMEWTVIYNLNGGKTNTMPDGQFAVKVQRTK